MVKWGRLARDSWLLQHVRDEDWQRQLHGRCHREGAGQTGLKVNKLVLLRGKPGYEK